MSFTLRSTNRRLMLVCVLASVAVLGGPVTLSGDESVEPDVIRVEEDWALQVGQPNGSIYSPQFHTLMSPLSHTNSYYFQVTWNYRELPEFMPGGFQVQSWKNNAYLDRQNVDSKELSRDAEVITWTQVLETNGSQIGFSVTNGKSLSWNSFGHPETTIIHDGSFQNLNQYTPATSVQNSWITFGQNRVVSLKIKEVRYFGADGLIKTDNTSRVVYQLESN